MKKGRNEDDFAKTAVLDRKQGQRPSGKDDPDALYREYVETTETVFDPANDGLDFWESLEGIVAPED